MFDLPHRVLDLIGLGRIFVCYGQTVVTAVFVFSLPCSGVDISVMVNQRADILAAEFFTDPQAFQSLGIQCLYLSVIQQDENHALAVSQRIGCILVAACNLSTCCHFSVLRINLDDFAAAVEIQIAVYQKLRCRGC